MAVVVSRTDDSAIDMELSQLSNVQEEDEHEPHEMETLMGKEGIEIDHDVPVPPELRMPRTPRMPMKTFADIKDPPNSTSTPAPQRQPSVTFRGVKVRTDPEDVPENNCNNTDDEHDEVKDLSEESGGGTCEDCKPIEPKSRGQFGLFLACIALSILGGFLAGYFLREEKYKQEILELEDNVCVTLSVPSSLTKQQLKYHDEVVQNISKTRLEEFSSMMSRSQCMSGTPCSHRLTNQLMKKLKDMGLPKVEGAAYNVLVSHPVLTIPSTLKTMDGEGNVMETITLYGSEKKNDTTVKPSSGNVNSPDGINKRAATDNILTPSMPMFVPYSANGTVQGGLLYVNCARRSDFTTIAGLGINESGRIGISRQCDDIATMEQVKNAEDNGLIGLLLYTDPADIKDTTSVTSGMGVPMSGMLGDPITPGCASKDGIRRDTKMADTLPTIPVQTIATKVAMALLGNITGKEAPGDWQGGFNFTYHVGMKSKKPLWTVELNVHNTRQREEIHNIMVTIPGTEYPDQYVMMGGHYTGGMSTSDPMSSSTATGSTSMVMEVASGLADLLQDGWEPKRTIMLSLWEGAEMGNSGSMEWAEEHKMVLADRTVAYIDLDTTMAAGTMVTVETSPVLKGVVMDATEQLELLDVVTTMSLDEMGDHVPFSHMLGVPSVSFHTTMDMDSSPVKNIDVSTTQLATKTLLLLADDPIIQYDGLSLADMVDGYVDHLATMMTGMTGANNDTMGNMKMTTTQYMQSVKTLQSMIDDLDDLADPVTIAMINERLMYMDKAFVMDGVTGMERHILYGKQQMETFPIMVDAMSKEEPNMETVEEMISMVQCMLQSATLSLSMPS